MEFVFQLLPFVAEEERENLLIFLLLGRLSTNFVQNAKPRVDKQCNIWPPISL